MNDQSVGTRSSANKEVIALSGRFREARCLPPELFRHVNPFIRSHACPDSVAGGGTTETDRTVRLRAAVNREVGEAATLRRRRLPRSSMDSSASLARRGEHQLRKRNDGALPNPPAGFGPPASSTPPRSVQRWPAPGARLPRGRPTGVDSLGDRREVLRPRKVERRSARKGLLVRRVGDGAERQTHPSESVRRSFCILPPEISEPGSGESVAMPGGGATRTRAAG